MREGYALGADESSSFVAQRALAGETRAVGSTAAGPLRMLVVAIVGGACPPACQLARPYGTVPQVRIRLWVVSVVCG